MRTQGANLILLFSIWEKVLLAGQSYREGRKEAGKQQGKEVVTGEADVGEYNISKLQQTGSFMYLCQHPVIPLNQTKAQSLLSRFAPPTKHALFFSLLFLNM